MRRTQNRPCVANRDMCLRRRPTLMDRHRHRGVMRHLRQSNNRNVERLVNSPGYALWIHRRQDVDRLHLYGRAKINVRPLYNVVPRSPPCR